MSSSRFRFGHSWQGLSTLLALMLCWVVPFLLSRQLPPAHYADLPAPSALFMSNAYQYCAAVIALTIALVIVRSIIQGNDHRATITHFALLIAVAHLLLSNISLLLPMIHIF